ncbi:MAG: AAA family ATPase [Tannerellaceae bacterium]|nr:AAA family ATPase [Tannerellaceae bacterium]
MKLSFENLGAIKKIDLDLSKKLIIFCGPNGTGKTYACYAIYGYLKFLLPGWDLFDLDELLQKKTVDVALDYTRLYKFRKGYFDYLKKHIKDVFGTNSAHYFNAFNSSDLSSEDQYAASLRQDEFEFTYNYNGVSITYTKEKESDKLCIKVDESIPLDKITDLTRVYHIATITKYLCNKSLLYSYILPVERNSAYTFADELAANRLKDAIPETKEQNYPSPIKDLLSIAVELKSIKNMQSNPAFQLLAAEIEENILQGKVIVSDEGALEFISKKEPEVVLPVHLSASIVKNISGLLIYLKHQARKNELLIIDEPEIGLHPDNQILLARIFARLINSGLRLLISTHSDYIIRELNNLIMLSSDKDEVKKKASEFHYLHDEPIQPGNVGAYLFDYNTQDGKNVVVQELPVNQNGFEVDTIDQAISLQNLGVYL